MKKILPSIAVSALALLIAAPSHAEVTANASVTNNYLWRGLTQTMNEAAVQGGVDWTDTSGLYAGTWVSNVGFDPGDVYSYENDLYFGYAGESQGLTYNIGYLYYNYDQKAHFDFGELHGSLGYGNFTANLFLLTNTQADEKDFPGTNWDFKAFKTYYVSGDYTIPLASGTKIGLHAGYYNDGDFSKAFNGVGDSYMDFNVSVAKDGFTFLVSKTTLGQDDDSDGVVDYASMPTRANDEVKFVLAYRVDFKL
jgi:uncharacterized protein (TIGR02001 family)